MNEHLWLPPAMLLTPLHHGLRAGAIHRHGQHVGDALAAQHDLQGLGVVAANLGSWLGTS